MSILSSSESKLIKGMLRNPQKDFQKIYNLIEKKFKIKKKTEMALRESEINLKRENNFNRNLIQTSPAYYAAINAEGKTILMNEMLLKVLGYNLNDVLSENHKKFVPERERDELERIFKKIINLHQPASTINHILTRDGEERLVEWHGRPVFKKNDEFDYFFGLGIDITEKTKSEKKLIESEKIYRGFLENFQGIAYQGNLDFTPIFFHGNVEKITGYKEIDFLSQKPRWDQIILDEDRKRLKDSFNKIRIDPDIIIEREYRIKNKSGEIKWINEIIQNLSDENARPYMVQGIIIDITNRKNTEQALKESEEKFRTLTEQSLLAIIILQDNKIKYANKAASKILGYTIEELLDTPQGEYINFYHPDDVAVVIEQAKKRQAGLKSEIQEYESRLFKKNGEMIWIQTFSRTIIYEGKTADMAIALDITGEKKVEQKLVESEKKYRTLFESSPNGVILVDLDGYIVECNSTIKSITGYNETELIGKNFKDLEIYQNDGLEKLSIGFDDIFKENKLESVEIAIKNRFGEMKWLQIRGTVIRRNFESIVFGVLSDVTSQKLAEKALVESEEKYRNLFNLAEVIILALDRDGKITSLNRKGYEIIGYVENSLIGKNWIDYCLPISERDFIKQNFRKTIKDQGLGNFYNENHVLTKDGKKRLIAWNNTIFRNKEGHFIGTLSAGQDITEKKILEETKANLLTRFSHEFKTPLISIKGFADFLLEKYEDVLDNKGLSFLKNIKMGGERLKVLINSFIESSQLGRNYGELDLQSGDLSNLIKRGVKEMEGLMITRNHTIDLDIKERIDIIMDKDKIYTVIINLLLNAIKYTPKGGMILVKTKINDDSVTLSIKDSGIGFTKQEKEQIFKVFGKIERFGHGWDIITDGIGMGLYICKSVVDSHEGVIWVESEGRNKGSIFSFKLPIKITK